jgi:hypothetical protein
MNKKFVWVGTIIAISLLPVKLKAEDPTATCLPVDVTGGGALYSFAVIYRDDGEVSRFWFDNNHVPVTGPKGLDVAAKFVSATSDIPGPQIGATYSIIPPGGSWDSGDNGAYQIVMQADQVFDGLGNAVAPGVLGTFQVTSTAPPPTPRPQSQAQLLNISTRLKVEPGDNVLIGGFVVGGHQPKKVLLRAIGPSLAQFGVTGALTDPVLELHGSDGSLISTNDDWKETQQAEIELTGAAPSSDSECAIVVTVSPDRYTAIVSGKGTATGVALVEGYDLDQPADSQLANVSTRGLVQTGDNVMIGGFILGNGSGTTNVLIRALGPSLAGSGLTTVLADPSLELHDENGVLVASNDNWKETQEAEIEATAIPPQNDLETAILVTIPATAHTVVVSGKDGGIGVALVEVYRLP